MAEIGVDISLASSFLKEGKIIGLPTETVYGLAGNAMNEASILEIYRVKNRPKFDPLIAHFDSLEKLSGFVTHLPEKAALLADAFWPGPLTLLLPKVDSVPDLLTSGLPRLAARIPQHPMALELLAGLDFPLAAPSANPFGYVSPTQAIHVNDQLGDQISYVLDGGSSQIGVESTIIGFVGDQPIVHRLGGIGVEALESVVGSIQIEINQSSNPVAPGMIKSHYSPGKKLIIGNIAQLLSEAGDEQIGIISFTKSYNTSFEKVLSPAGDLDEAARNLFKALRFMGNADIETILTEPFPNHGIGRAINDRLQRAAAK